jgi:hypothetical protein
MPLLDAGLVVRNFLNDARKNGVVIDSSNPKLSPVVSSPLMSWIDAAAKITERDYVTLTHDPALGVTTSNSAADTDGDTSDTRIIASPISKRQIVLEQVIGNKCVFISDKPSERLPVNQQLYRESSMSFHGTKAKRIHIVSI